jgi:Flp pilus assembly pilin Flp
LTKIRGIATIYEVVRFLIFKTVTTELEVSSMLKQFLADEQGQTTVEYLLIIAVIVVVISVLGKNLKEQLPKTVQIVFDGVNKKIAALMSAAMQN